MPFCSQCGTSIEPTAKFCANCGTPVAPGSPVAPPPIPSTAPTMTHNGLFDPMRTGYVINENSWDMGDGDILDERGQKIGYMDRKILSLRAEIKLTEIDGTVAATIHRKIVAVKPTYEIKDNSDNLVGKIEKALLSLRPKLAVKDSSGNKLLEVKGNFKAWDFTVKDMHGREIGNVKKLDRWKDALFGGGMFDRSDKYALKIHGDIDRRLVVGAVIAIDNMFHDETDHDDDNDQFDRF